MASHRFTIRLDDAQADWVEQEANRRDRSQAWVLSEVVDAVREGGESVYATPDRTDAHRTAPKHTDAVREQLDRIEADVTAVREVVEREGDASTADAPARDGEHEAATDAPAEPATAHEATAGDTAAAVEDVLADWSHGRGAQEREASAQVAHEALTWLRDHGGEVRKADVPLDELGEDDPLGRTTDTLWTQVVRAAFQHATDRGAVEQPTSRTYRWVGEA
jgi:hypothetical protein